SNTFTQNQTFNGNVTASNFFGFINWSWVQNVPNFLTSAIVDLWPDNNANDLLVSNGTNIGYNETVFNQSVINIGLISGFNSSFNETYDLYSYNHTEAVDNLYGADYRTTFNDTYDLYSYNHTSDALSLAGELFLRKDGDNGTGDYNFNG